MYKSIKNIIKSIIPKKLLFRFEPFFRFFIYILYIGKNYECTVCGKKLRKFIGLKDGDRLCPCCGSLARNRRLWSLLQNDILQKKINVLDFSPSRCLYRKLKDLPGINYTATDLSGDFIADKSYDITQIDSGDDSYDVIICYHILEHIDDDLKAMKELHRVLKKNGLCIVQTPFKEGEIYENPDITSPKERAQHFGQADHIRIYSIESLEERLQQTGFKMDIIKFIEERNNRNGYNVEETVLVCTKN